MSDTRHSPPSEDAQPEITDEGVEAPLVKETLDLATVRNELIHQK